MRITFLTTKLNLKTGGGSNISLDLKARELQSLGFEVKIITVLGNQNKIDTKYYQIIKENIVDTNPRKNIKGIEQILKKHEDETDIYIVDGHSFIWGAALYKKNNGQVKVIVDLFSFTESANFFQDEPNRMNIERMLGLSMQRVWEKWFAKKHLRYINLFTYTSPVIKNFYKKFHIPEEKMKFVPPFTKLGDDTTNTELHKLNQNEFRIIFVGRLVRYKGVDFLLKALKKIDNANIWLDVVGDGPDKDRLRKIKNKLGLKNVKWHGFLGKKELENIYKNAHVLIHPTIDPEPFGMVVLEAMSFGLPIITSKGSGSEWVADKAGLAFKNKSINDLKNKIIKIYNNRGLRDEMSRKAVERVKYFNYKTWGIQLKEILFKLK